MDEQEQAYFIEWFTAKEPELQDIYGDDITPSVRRLALITYRIAMVLSIIRHMDKGDINHAIQCHPDDFYIAIT